MATLISSGSLPETTPSSRGVDLAAGGAEVDLALIERIDRHRIAQDADVAILFAQAFAEFVPLIAAGAAAVDAQLAVKRKVFAVTLDGHNVNGFGLVRVL